MTLRYANGKLVSEELARMAVAAILARTLTGERRDSLAARLRYSERQVQAWLSGLAAKPATEPLIEWLTALGLCHPGGGRMGRWATDLRVSEVRKERLLTLADALESYARGRPRINPREAMRLVKEARLLCGRFDDIQDMLEVVQAEQPREIRRVM